MSLLEDEKRILEENNEELLRKCGKQNTVVKEKCRKTGKKR